ncbi:MAG TPA: hypothetical protein DGT21_18500 [Armatimonadetes bacterium]|jgi:hypothetical protein|nr:hypothetical protein [Armatimonadota bacterium]
MLRIAIVVTALVFVCTLQAVALELSTPLSQGAEQLICMPSGAMHAIRSMQVDLPAGETELAFDYAAEGLDAASVRLIPVSPPSGMVISARHQRPDAAGRLFWAVNVPRTTTAHFRVWYVPKGIGVRPTYSLHRAGEARAELRMSVTTSNGGKEPLEGLLVRLASGLSYQASVPAGSEATQELFVLRDLPLSTSVIYDEAAYGKQPMAIWTVQCPSRAQPLVSGPIGVFDGAAPGSALLGRATLPFTPAGAEAELPVRPVPEYQVTGGLLESVQQNARTDVYGKLALSDTLDSYECTFFNRSADPMELVFRVHAEGDWTIERSSADYSRVDATTAEWRVAAGPAQATTLTYSILKRSIIP